MNLACSARTLAYDSDQPETASVYRRLDAVRRFGIARTDVCMESNVGFEMATYEGMATVAILPSQNALAAAIRRQRAISRRR